MTREEIKSTIERLLGEIAPEVDFAQLNPAVALRDQIDLDSMDFLNFIIALSKEMNVEIPESDYQKMMTLNACVDYLFALQQ
jgi:acyl carrier protein